MRKLILLILLFQLLFSVVYCEKNENQEDYNVEIINWWIKDNALYIKYELFNIGEKVPIQFYSVDFKVKLKNGEVLNHNHSVTKKRMEVKKRDNIILKIENIDHEIEDILIEEFKIITMNKEKWIEIKKIRVALTITGTMVGIFILVKLIPRIVPAPISM
jgi:hypothetical protein